MIDLIAAAGFILFIVVSGIVLYRHDNRKKLPKPKYFIDVRQGYRDIDVPHGQSSLAQIIYALARKRGTWPTEQKLCLSVYVQYKGTYNDHEVGYVPMDDPAREEKLYALKAEAQEYGMTLSNMYD
jgi:hypothetical protein